MSGSIGKELLRAADLSEEKEDLFKFENDESWIMRYERELVYFILCELNFELVLRFLYTVYFHFMKRYTSTPPQSEILYFLLYYIDLTAISHFVTLKTTYKHMGQLWLRR